jgi:hypothetical protein
MTIHSLADPLEQLSRADRRRWRQDGRRVQQAYEASQLRVLRSLAATHAEVGCLATVEGAVRSEQLDRFEWAGRRAPGWRLWEAQLDRRGGVERPERAYPLAVAVECFVGGRRLVGRASDSAWASLEAAMARGPVQLGGAGRYGPFWTLTFEGRAGPLVVLANRVALLPSPGEVADRPRGAGAPTRGLKRPSRQLGRPPDVTPRPVTDRPAWASRSSW